ncbi:MAG: ArnT family glycosyltransferase [Cyanobacteriota bacterium]
MIPDLLVGALCLVSLGLSILESRLNVDAHHWGLMYSNATDLNLGMLPYKEFFIQYGFLTTWIHSLALRLFGNAIASVGIMTGIFYAANLFLSYVLWQKILNKWLSVLSVLLMFLLHTHITYPWSNYLAYSFLLLSLVCLVHVPPKKSWYFLAGLFWSCSVLCRQTFIVFIAPFGIYFLWKLLVFPGSRRAIFGKQIAFFAVGSALVFASFFLFLLKIDALQNWYLQSVRVVNLYNYGVGAGLSGKAVFVFKNIINSAVSLSDARLTMYSLIFIACVIILLMVASGTANLARFGRLGAWSASIETESALLIYSLTVIVGFFQAMPTYELWRLQSSSSLGVGVVVFCLNQFRLRHLNNVSLKSLRLSRFNMFIVLLSMSIVITMALAYLQPWAKFSRVAAGGQPKRGGLAKLMSGSLKSPPEIPIFRGKLYSGEVINYYEEIKSAMDQYSSKLAYVVNFTMDSTVPYLTDKVKRPHRSPFYIRSFGNSVFPDEPKVIDRLIDDGKVIIVAPSKEDIPASYCIVLQKDSPRLTFVAVPRAVASNCKVS